MKYEAGVGESWSQGRKQKERSCSRARIWKCHRYMTNVLTQYCEYFLNRVCVPSLTDVLLSRESLVRKVSNTFLEFEPTSCSHASRRFSLSAVTPRGGVDERNRSARRQMTLMDHMIWNWLWTRTGSWFLPSTGGVCCWGKLTLSAGGVGGGGMCGLSTCERSGGR